MLVNSHGENGAVARRLRAGASLQPALFFLYGACATVFLLAPYVRFLVRFAAGLGRGSAPPAYLGRIGLHMLVLLAGGGFAAWFFSLLVIRWQRAPRSSWPSAILRGAWYGVLGTGLAAGTTALVFAVLAAPFLVAHIPSGQFPRLAGWRGLPFAIPGLLVEAGSYGAITALHRAPLELLYGALGAVYVLAFSRADADESPWQEAVLDKGTASLALGIFGAAFASAPLLSVPLGILATVHGVRSGAWGRGARGPKIRGRVGTVLGVACVLYFLYGLGLLYLGWRSALPRYP